MSIFIQTLSYQNASKRKVVLIVEPWAERYGVEPDQQVDIVGQGGEAGSKFEVLHTDNEVIVFGWAGSVVTVMRDGEEISPDEQN